MTLFGTFLDFLKLTYCFDLVWLSFCSHYVAQDALKLIILLPQLFSTEITGTYHYDLLNKLTLTCSPKMSQRLVILLLKWPNDSFKAIFINANTSINAFK